MTLQEWALKNTIPIVGILAVLVSLYFAVGKVDDLLATRNAELRGQVKQDIADAQKDIKQAVSDAETHIKEAKAAEGKAGDNAGKGKGKADAAAKKNLTDMVSEWNK